MANGDQPDPSQLPAVDPLRQQITAAMGQAGPVAPPQPTEAANVPPPPPQAASPAPAYAPQQGNSIKRLLGNFFYGGGQAMMKHVGLPTDEELQQKQFQQNLQLRQTQSLEGMRQADEAFKAQQLKHSQATLDALTRYPMSAAMSKAIGHPELEGTMTNNNEFAGYLKAAIPGQIAGPYRLQAAQTAAESKTPTEIALQIRADKGDEQAKRILSKMQADKMALQTARGAAFGMGRTGGYVDPATGEIHTATAGTAISQDWVPAAPGMQVMSKQAQFGEIHSASSKLRDSITNLDRDFTPAQRAKLQFAMRSPDEGVLSALRDSLLGTEQLTEKQQDFVIWLTQMHERILSLRNIAGMGQGSQDLRAAIQATLPNVKSADKGYALKQMDAVDNQINKLEQGIPRFRGQRGAAGGGTTGPIYKNKAGDRIQWNGTAWAAVPKGK